MSKKGLIKEASVIFVLIVVIAIIVIGNPKGPKLMNKELSIISEKKSINNVNIYNYKERIAYFNGWETLFNYSGKEERVLGTNAYRNAVEANNSLYAIQSLEDRVVINKLNESNIESVIKKGWFYKEEDNIKDVEEDKVRYVFWENESKEIKKIGYVFKINKNFLKVNLFFDSNDNEKGNGCAYGLTLNGYDVYLSNGTILKNDKSAVKKNEKRKVVLNGKELNLSSGDPLLENIDLEKEVVILNGSSYKNYLADKYEVFYNNKTAIIVYGDAIDYAENYFKWEVFRFYVTEKEKVNMFDSLYIGVFNEATLIYEDNTWNIKSKQFNGRIEEWIQSLEEN